MGGRLDRLQHGGSPEEDEQIHGALKESASKAEDEDSWLEECHPCFRAGLFIMCGCFAIALFLPAISFSTITSFPSLITPSATEHSRP